MGSTDDIKSSRESLGDLWCELKSGVWHTTRIKNLSQILDDQFIRPKGGGTNNQKNGYCSSEGWISLFDFQSPLEEEILKDFFNYGTKFLSPITDGQRDKCTIWIKIKIDWINIQTKKTPCGIVNNDEGCLKMGGMNFIRRVEICCKESIPIKSFDYIIMVCSADGKTFEKINLSGNVMDQITSIQNKWNKEFIGRYEELNNLQNISNRR